MCVEALARLVEYQQRRIFHERATQATLEAAARRIVVTKEPLVLPAIPVSESGYLAIPHKNKFGKDYAPMEKDGGYPR